MFQLQRLRAAYEAATRARPAYPAPIRDIFGTLDEIAPTPRPTAILAFVELRELREAMPVGIPFFGGTIVGYANRLAEGLLRFAGDGGSLFFATESIRDPRLWSLRGDVFDPGATRCVDLFGEILRQRADAVRSEIPLFNLSAIGPLASILATPPSDDAEFPMGAGTPWEKLTEIDPLVVHIGGTRSADWTMLTISHLDNAGYERPAFFAKPWPFRQVGADGKTRERRWRIHGLRNALEYRLETYLRFEKYAAALAIEGDGVRRAHIGRAEIAAFRLSDRIAAQRRLMARGVYLEDMSLPLTPGAVGR